MLFAGGSSFYTLEGVVQDLFGFKHVLPEHQGRWVQRLGFFWLGSTHQRLFVTGVGAQRRYIVQPLSTPPAVMAAHCLTKPAGASY
jgi:hypothetical protein